jgi:AcrR family transcriptional regulator
MARPPTLTDDEILQRARAVFVERGYGARTAEIAAAVGLSWGALVFRFGGKAELFRRAMADSVWGSGAVDWLAAGGGDLHRLLEQLSSHLWEQWPIHLQYRLALPCTHILIDRILSFSQ